MKNPKKKVNRGLIVLNKGERIAVISLLSVIAILLAFSIFRPAINFSRKEKMAFHNLDSLIAIQEKAVQKEKAKAEEKSQPPVSQSKPERPPENPHQSGLKQNNQTQPSQNQKKTITTAVKSIPILDLNLADSTELIALPQIGEVMASRIHRYRNRLGGFVSLDQLFEIKGMDTVRFEAIKPYITLKTNEIKKINVNQDEFKTLLKHPYLEYDQVKAIVNHRERKGHIKDWNQLKDIVGETNPLIEEYVRY